MTITLQPGSVSLSQLETIYWTGEPARLDPAADAAISKAAARIAEIAAGNEAVYGINTGFGKLASIKIDAADTATLQRNLILSHCCGVGAPLAENIVRLIMSLKLISLGRGASGVRLDLVRLIEAMLDKGVIPVIPEKGSVGASGDLAPLAHLAAVMMGEGEAFHAGERLPGKMALERAGLTPVVLAAKEGLDIDSAGAGRPVPRPPRRQCRLDNRRHVHRCRHGIVRTFPSGYPHLARTQGPDRYRRRAACASRRLRNSRKPFGRRRARPRPLLHPLPAASRRRLP